MSLTITVCHQWASLVMPNGDPLIYPYSINHRNVLNALIAGLVLVTWIWKLYSVLQLRSGNQDKISL